MSEADTPGPSSLTGRRAPVRVAPVRLIVMEAPGGVWQRHRVAAALPREHDPIVGLEYQGTVDADPERAVCHRADPRLDWLGQNAMYVFNPDTTALWISALARPWRAIIWSSNIQACVLPVRRVACTPDLPVAAAPGVTAKVPWSGGVS